MDDDVYLAWYWRAITFGWNVLEFADCREQRLFNLWGCHSTQESRIGYPTIGVNGNFHDQILFKTRLQVIRLNNKKRPGGLNGKLVVNGRNYIDKDLLYVNAVH